MVVQKGMDDCLKHYEETKNVKEEGNNIKTYDGKEQKLS
jgi:hypothetical protein